MGTNGHVSDSSFVNNFAKRSGGAIHWNNDNGVVSGCSFVNNSAKSGGAIYWQKDNGVVSGCVFVNNSAEDDGVIYFLNLRSHGTLQGQNLTINDNIFLNNEGLAISFYENDSTSNVDYNWFGNNATNYDMAPGTNNTGITTWLFLNATADSASISISESSDILFKLYSYDSTEVSDYDNSKLPVVNLTVAATNGDVDKETIVLGDSVVYTPNSVGDASVTASIENAEYTIVLDVVKSDSVLSGDNLVMSYKDGSAWVVTLTDGVNPIAGAAIKVGIYGKVYNRVTDADGVARLVVNLAPGSYA
ncbi:right-handed parallel beta-helix repeat-containing protein, partial [Methanobrevibacter sp.]|uniref:right-handed parallel beta-helix repeat-containing protein n=1 Tax=Methanobrevibacter sp. TaxID=66852 RepID=UPI00386DCF2B